MVCLGEISIDRRALTIQSDSNTPPDWVAFMPAVPGGGGHGHDGEPVRGELLLLVEHAQVLLAPAARQRQARHGFGCCWTCVGFGYQ